MRYLKYLALLAILVVPAAYSHAQIAVGLGWDRTGMGLRPARMATMTTSRMLARRMGITARIGSPVAYLSGPGRGFAEAMGMAVRAMDTAMGVRGMDMRVAGRLAMSAAEVKLDAVAMLYGPR